MKNILILNRHHLLQYVLQKALKFTTSDNTQFHCQLYSCKTCKYLFTKLAPLIWKTRGKKTALYFLFDVAPAEKDNTAVHHAGAWGNTLLRYDLIMSGKNHTVSCKSLCTAWSFLYFIMLQPSTDIILCIIMKWGDFYVSEVFSYFKKRRT